MTSGLTIESHSARVISNDDPDKKGRVRVSCIGLLGDDETDLPMWVEPAMDWGWFYIPDVGEIIDIEVITGSDQDESIGQMSIDNLNVRWKSIRYFNEDADVPTPINPQFTSKNYAKRRGFATPNGHVLVFDDTIGDTGIKLTWTAKKDAIDAASITTLEFDKDGYIHINILDKTKIDISNTEFHFNNQDKQKIDLVDDNLTLILGGGAGLDIKGHDADAVSKFGDAAVSAAVAEHLKDLYAQLKSYIENALVNTGLGPSATIMATMGPAPEWDDKIVSSSLKIPDTK